MSEHVRDFYDPDAVAHETAAERYANYEPPTLCDCGEIAERGQVYCAACKDAAKTAYETAIYAIRKYNSVDREAAISQLVWAIEED